MRDDLGIARRMMCDAIEVFADRRAFAQAAKPPKGIAPVELVERVNDARLVRGVIDENGGKASHAVRKFFSAFDDIVGDRYPESTDEFLLLDRWPELESSAREARRALETDR